MELLQQNQTAEPLMFFMVDSSDRVSGKTGLSPTVTLSKNGAAFAACAGSVTEVGNGWYKVAGNATDANTLGPLKLHATASGADPSDMSWQVVAFNPQSGTNLGLSAFPTASPGANSGLPTVDANNNIHGVQPGTGTGQLNPSGGKIPATLNATDVTGNVPANMVVATAAVQLAASQPNYAPATASALSTLSTAVANLNNLSALANLFAPSTLVRPPSGSLTYVWTLTIRDSEGNLIDLDASALPTLALVNSSATDRSSYLSGTAHASTGVYTGIITIASTAGVEGLHFSATGTANSQARRADAAMTVADADSLSDLSAILSQVNLIGTNAADSPNAVSAQNTIATNLNATVASRSTYAGGAVASVTAAVNLPANAPSTFLDTISITQPTGSKSGWTFPQRMMALFARFFNKVTQPDTITSGGTQTIYKDDNTTQLATMTVTDDGTNQTQGGV